MFIAAAILLYGGIVFAIHADVEFITKIMITFLMLVDAFIYIGFIFIKKYQWIVYLLIAFLIANIILTFTDDVGFVDIFFVIINIVNICLYYGLFFWHKDIHIKE